MALVFEAYSINDNSRGDLSYCAVQAQLIARIVMAKDAAREGQGQGIGMRKKSMEGRNEPGCVLCSQGPSEGKGGQSDRPVFITRAPLSRGYDCDLSSSPQDNSPAKKSRFLLLFKYSCLHFLPYCPHPSHLHFPPKKSLFAWVSYQSRLMHTSSHSHGSLWGNYKDLSEDQAP